MATPSGMLSWQVKPGSLEYRASRPSWAKTTSSMGCWRRSARVTAALRKAATESVAETMRTLSRPAEAAGSSGVGVLQGGQDGLDRDAVRHSELAGEAGLVGVQSEAPFLGKDDELDGLLAALGASDGGVEEGGHGVGGGDHTDAVDAGGGGGEAEAHDEGDDGHDDDHLDQGDASAGCLPPRVLFQTGMLIHRRDAEALR